MRLMSTVLVVALATVVLACGEDTVDAGKVEEGIQEDLSSATAQIVSVSCPDDVKKEEGKTFTCDAKLEGGGKAQVTVTQTDNRGNGTYAFKPGTLQLGDNSVEPALEESLAAKGVSDPQVDCPDLIPVNEGETVTCTATGAGGRTGDVTFTWSSDDGTIDNSSVEGPEQ
jgi:Domain of unknown function (DUF4333)